MKPSTKIVIASCLIGLVIGGGFFVQKDGPASISDTVAALELRDFAGSASHPSSGLFIRDGSESTGFMKQVSADITASEFRSPMDRELVRLGWRSVDKPEGVDENMILAGSSYCWQRGMQVLRAQLVFPKDRSKTAYIWIQRPASIAENISNRIEAWKATRGGTSPSMQISISPK